MNIRCVIVDDEHLARTLLEEYVKKLPQLQLVATCKNPLEAMEVMQREVVDLMFLDIQMPELTGVEFLKSMVVKPAVVFTTAYSEYALEGYQLDVVDYLVKPFPFERFLKAVNKASELIRLKKLDEEQSPAQLLDGFIVVHADRKIYKIGLDEIKYIEGLKEYVSYYTEEKRIIALESLKRLEDILPSDRFMRVHRSYIVPIGRIKKMDGNQLEIGGKLVPVGRSYREVVLRKVFGE